MKPIRKISLVSISKEELDRSTQRLLYGGKVCICTATCTSGCGCMYAGPQEGPDDSFYGGSSTAANNNANVNGAAHSDASSLAQSLAYSS